MSAAPNSIPVVPRRAPPSGTITFAFTDIAGSTMRWDRDRAAMEDAVRRHDAIMRGVIAAGNGYVFKTIGDAFCAAFSRPEDAVGAMLHAQRALMAEDFSAVDGIQVRMAIHTGTADERDGDYFGPAVNRVARLLGVAYGGQVLLSGVTSDLVQGSLPSGASLRDLGEHRLKDLSRPEHVRQLVAPDLAADFPPLRSLDASANNLRPELTSFIGREVEIAEITALLGKHRLVTLVGSGGIGKTRLSLQLAANAVAGSGDGVWFVELAPLLTGDGIPTAIAQAIGITLGDGDPLQRLLIVLEAKKLLLVLDNCEHLVEAAARVVAGLLRSCPHIAILASSRQALGIAGEASYRVPSLGVPAATSGVAVAELRAEHAMTYTAVALFVERARAMDNRFALSDENAPIIADICCQLDGIALAIELAAARVKILNPRQLRERLGERFRVLTGGGRDRPPRQQTLRALIDWSYDLLDEREQRFFRRLGIFVNGLTLEAATAVGGAGEFDEFESFDLVSSLVEKSLLIAEFDTETQRYSLLESVRSYALEKLASTDEQGMIAQRHLGHFVACFTALRQDADDLRPGLNDAFMLEREDIRAALDRALIAGDITQGAKLLAALYGAWREVGLMSEGVARLEAFIARLGSAELMLAAQLRSALAFMYISVGRYESARATAAIAVDFARESGEQAALAGALDHYTFALMVCRDFEAAGTALSEAERIAGASRFVRLHLTEWRAHLSSETGDLDGAERAFSMLREDHRSHGRQLPEAFALAQLADIAFRRTCYDRAAELFSEAILLSQNHNNHSYFRILYCALRAISEEVDEAIVALKDAFAVWVPLDAEHMITTMALELAAYLAALRQDGSAAARLAGYAEARVARNGFIRDSIPQAIHERIAPLLDQLLEAEDRSRLTSEGASLTANAAIALADEVLSPGTPRDMSAQSRRAS